MNDRKAKWIKVLFPGKVGNVLTSPPYLGNLSFSMETAPCWNMPIHLSIWEQIFTSLLSTHRSANDASILLCFFLNIYNGKSLFPPTLFLKTSGWPANINQPASQAEAIANSFHFHRILEEGRKLKSTFLDSLEAKVLDAIYILPTRCLCWQHRSLKPWELDSIFHIPQLQGCKKIEEGGR